MTDSPVALPDFAKDIEELVAQKRLGYMDAILHWGERNGVEEAVLVDLVKQTPIIKSKLQAEAEVLCMLKKSGARLPI